ncbi:MAG: hypothetical protein H6738_12715 [Alphaproteobacteria bacterium]|nr:hypothetical protein [Alphaproteobacteria bacterium]
MERAAERNSHLWMSLAPAVIGDPVDAVLYLFASRFPKRPMLERLRQGVLRWWLSEGASPPITELTTARQRKLLDDEIRSFIESRGYEEDLRAYIDLRPEPVHPLLVMLLPDSCAEAQLVFPRLRELNERLWLECHRKIPERPWSWLIIYALPRLRLSDDESALVRLAVGEDEVKPSVRTQGPLEADGAIVRIIRSLTT